MDQVRPGLLIITRFAAAMGSSELALCGCLLLWLRLVSSINDETDMEGKLIYEHHLVDPLATGLGDEFVEANQWHSQGAQTLQSLLYTSDS